MTCKKLSLCALVLAVVAGGLAQVARAGAGYQRAASCVMARGIDRYDAVFAAGDLAVVSVIGDHDTDLDLYVYDENGNLIASDIDSSDNCYVTFAPRWTGRFVIRIVNRGSVYNCYALQTN